MADFSKSVVYQIYPRSFKDSDGDGLGDLAGIIEKLDYLQELGIDYLWITPFFKSPQRDNGYDVSDYCSIEPSFGTMEEVEQLIQEAEKRGIGIMLDMVFNHTSTEHEWFQRALAGEKEYQDYYIFKDGTPDKMPTNWTANFGGPVWEYVDSLKKWYLHIFDVSQADLNWNNPKVREELKKIILFWKEKGIKGFRFDAVNFICKPEVFEDDPDGNGMRFYTDGPHIHEYLKELVRDTGIADFINVGEMATSTVENCVRCSNPKEKEFAMCFNFDHVMSDFPNGDKWGFPSLDKMALKRIYEKWQLGMQEHGGWNALYWCNHDQPRIVSRFGNEKEYWKQSAKMLATSIHMMKGTPYIYQGEEIGMTNAHFTDISQYRDVESLNYYKILLGQGKTEEEVMRIIGERSRDNSRTPMQWSDEENAGFGSGTPWIGVIDNYKQINAKSQMEDETSIRGYYKRLIRLRKEREAIAIGKIEFLERENENVLAYKRSTEKEQLYVYNNLTENEVEITLVAGQYRKILSSYEEEGIVQGTIVLKPYEAIVLEKLS